MRGATTPSTTLRTRVSLGGLALALAVAIASTSVIGALAPPAEAGIFRTFTVSGTSTATSDLGASVRIGDVFRWSVTFDLDRASTGSTPSFGNTFNDAIQSFTLTADTANTGTWDPAGVTWPIAPAHNVVGNANGDQLTVQLRPTDAPAMDGVPFLDLGLTLDWDPADVDAVWVAGVTSLAAFLGTTTPDATRADVYFELRNSDFDSASFTSTVGDDGGASDDLRAAPSGSTTLHCDPTQVGPGTTVRAQVTGGDPGIDILWRVAGADGEVLQQGPVQLSTSGEGAFAFTVPIRSSGPLTVELVEWDATCVVAVADEGGALVPNRIAAGEGSSSPWQMPLIAMTLAAGLVTILRRRVRVRRA
jgi:hypothetical protein